MQPKPLITLDDVLLQHCSNHTVVTANERLAKALIDANARHHRDLDGSPTPRVAPLTDYLCDRYRALAPIESRTLLSAEAQRLVWLELTPDLPELDFVGLYPGVADAWRLMHDWDLVTLLEQFDDNENHRLFRDWSQRYRRTARQRGWVTAAEIPVTIESAVRERRLPPDTLLLLGFDVVPPSLERLFDAYRSVGATVLRFDSARPVAASIATASCNDSEQELRAAIRWARSILKGESEPRSICIAVPDLVESHDRVVRQLDAILRPEDFAPTAAASPYNISGGVPLSEVPVVADALDLLEWLFEPYHHTRIDSLLRSPFLRLSFVSTGNAAQQPEWCDAARFSVLAPAAAPLREIVQRASTLGLLDLRNAMDGATQLLDLAGWPNTGRLSSESFQAYGSFEGLLDELAASSDFVRPRHFAAWLRQLRAAAHRRLFAPERPEAPIQVLGYLETIGLDFTHLWVTGLSQLEWPRSPAPTPYIPIRLLKAASVARSDADGEVAFARRLMGHWRTSAASIVFSHPMVRDDVASRRSVLIDEHSPTAELHLGGTDHALCHPFLVRRISLETRDDTRVGRTDLERLRHRGTGILRDQSACPFRAFARYRLDALPRAGPHSFPDATDRGVAVHAALRRLFDRLADIDFQAIDDAALEQAVSESAMAAISTLGPLPAPFRVSERERVTALLFEWLTIERQRRASRIVATEAAANLNLGGIDFDLRIDRIDGAGDGSLIVIDYKTGPTSPRVVMGSRPEEPQLPMYALSASNVTAIAYAFVRRDDCRMSGWSNSTLSTSQNSERIRFDSVGRDDDDWNALLDQWRESLTSLATEFREGISHVQPRDAGVCEECNLHSLCRIREKRRLDLA